MSIWHFGALTLACLTCTSYGQQVQDNMLSSQPLVDVRPSNALARLLLASHPEVAFGPSAAIGIRARINSQPMATLRPVMSVSDEMSSRRGMLSKLAAGAAAFAAAAASPMKANAVRCRVGDCAPLTGEYDDPNHPGCLRKITVFGSGKAKEGFGDDTRVAVIKGVDGLPAGQAACQKGLVPSLEDLWIIKGEVQSDDVTVEIDFTEKSGGKVGLVEAFYDKNGKKDGTGKSGILFPDGNKWTKVEEGTPERRIPKSGKRLSKDYDPQIGAIPLRDKKSS